MCPPSRLRLIGARATALGGVATIFGVIGHVQAGGSDPGLAVIALIWLGSSLISGMFLTRQAGLLRIAALLLAEQVLVHVSLMSFVGMPAPIPSMPGMAGMAGMLGMENMPGMMSAPSPMSVFPSVDMLLAHTVAAVIAGLWLWRGECALWSLLDRATLTFRVRWLIPTVSAAAPDLRIEAEAFPHWGIRIAREVPRRGPPRMAVL